MAVVIFAVLVCAVEPGLLYLHSVGEVTVAPSDVGPRAHVVILAEHVAVRVTDVHTQLGADPISLVVHEMSLGACLAVLQFEAFLRDLLLHFRISLLVHIELTAPLLHEVICGVRQVFRLLIGGILLVDVVFSGANAVEAAVLERRLVLVDFPGFT